MANVYISIGHGVRPNGTFDPGACSTTTPETEYDGNRALATEVTAALRVLGHQVESEADLPPKADTDYQGSVDRANAKPRALALDLHMDWEQGSSALCWPLVHPSGGESTRIANQIISTVAGAGLSTKGPTARSDLWWLNGTSSPAILIEAGRVGSPRPVPQLAAAIASGIDLALGGVGMPEGTHPQPPAGGAPPGDATIPPTGEAPPWPGVYLEVTTTDPAAQAWQAQMAKRGWSIDVDGIYGPASAQTCRAFQDDKALEVDGIVGPATWTATWSTPVT